MENRWRCHDLIDGLTKGRQDVTQHLAVCGAELLSSPGYQGDE